jgi:hypothetical protein
LSKDTYLNGYDEVAGNKKYLTGSQITTMCECPVEYRKRYIERLPTAPSSSIAFGLSGHKAEEVNLRQKIKTKKDEPLDVVLDIFNHTLKEYRSDIEWSKDERKVGKRKSFNALQVEGMDTMEKVHLEISPKIKPLSVEEKVRITLKDFPFDILGTPDVMTRRDVLDFKFMKRSPNQKTADNNLNLTIYSMAKAIRDNRLPRFVRLIGGVRLKSGAKTFDIKSKRNESDFKQVLRTVGKIQKIIENDIWLPASILSWKCSPGFCSYFNQCTEKMVRK